MADETAPQTAQDTPAGSPDPQAAPVADPGTEPQVSPDPTSTGSTSQDSTEQPSGDALSVTPNPTVAVAPVTVDNRTRRSSDDALLGSWVDVISGPNAGRFGSYVDTVHHDAETGFPTVILIRSRDSRNELLEVAYEDVRPSERSGGR